MVDGLTGERIEYATEENGLMPYSEIAARLGVSVQTIYVIERRAMRKIKRAIENNVAVNHRGWADMMEELGYPNAGI